MLTASRPVLGPSTATMGISYQDENFAPAPNAQGVYLAITVGTCTPRNDSESSDEIILENGSSDSELSGSSAETSPVPFSKQEGQEVPDDSLQSGDEQKTTEIEDQVETPTPCVRPKYGTAIIGLPDKFMKKVGTVGLEKKKEKTKKKKWRSLDAEDMGFKLTLFPREPVTCDEKQIECEHKIFDAMIETELDNVSVQIKPFRHLLQLEGTRVMREDKFTRRDSNRRVQKAHKQVKSKYMTSVLNNRGRKTLYVHFRLYKRHPFLHCSNLEHPNLPSQAPREGVCLEVARAAFKAQARVPVQNAWGYDSSHPSHPAQNLTHALDNGNADNELPVDIISFLINLQHREMTPEDYEMLLRLDESVAPKTVDQEVITSFHTDVVDASSVGDLCTICMEAYEVGQARKFLPCEHVFHVQCIDMWLSNSSQNCPLDGLPVGFS